MSRRVLTNTLQIYGLVVSVLISGNRMISRPGFFAHTLTNYPQLLRRCHSSRASFNSVLVFPLVSLASLLVSPSELSVTPVSGVLRSSRGSSSEWLVHLSRSGSDH